MYDNSFYFFSGDNQGTYDIIITSLTQNLNPFGPYYYITSREDLTAAFKHPHLLHSEVQSGDRQCDCQHDCQRDRQRDC